MQEYKIKISKKIVIWETQIYKINASDAEEAKKYALDDGPDAKTTEDVGVLSVENTCLEYDTLMPVTPEENYYLTEKGMGCDGNFNPEDIKYKTVEIEVL
jgi:hypothetical protein